MEKRCVVVFQEYLKKEHCKNVLAMLKKLGVDFDEPSLSKLDDGKDVLVDIIVNDNEVMEILKDMSMCDYISLSNSN